MNIDHHLVIAINDRRTGPISNPMFDPSEEGAGPWQFKFSTPGVVTIDFGDSKEFGCHLQRTEAQLRRLGGDLRVYDQPLTAPQLSRKLRT